jgi:glycosyltransferase involved in cell wall biosynthesis
MLFSYIKSFQPMHQTSTEPYVYPKSASIAKESKILLVGMLDSPHFQKWLSIVQQEFPSRQLLIFPSDRPRLYLANLKCHKKNFRSKTKIFKILPNIKINFALYYLFDLTIGPKWRSYCLARYIIKYRPEVIHFHEMQHGAYLFNSIANYRKMPKISRKIVSTWGSDLTLYSWVNEHMLQIRSCFTWVDVLTAEKKNELKDASKLGFNGKFIAPVYINLGQMPLKNTKFVNPSERRVILIKGHQSDTGRSLNVLHVLSTISSQLKDFEIIVYSASIPTQIQVDLLRNKNQIDIKIMPKVQHSEMAKAFEKARVSISLAVSDGLPGVLVEAMAAGAFPIQSKNSAGGEFLLSGKSGFLVDPWDLNGIKKAIISAVKNDYLVDSAAEINKKTLGKKYSLNRNKQVLRQLYL